MPVESSVAKPDGSAAIGSDGTEEGEEEELGAEAASDQTVTPSPSPGDGCASGGDDDEAFPPPPYESSSDEDSSIDWVGR